MLGMAHVSARKVLPLNDGWRYRPISNVDPNGKWQEVTLPHTWNAFYEDGKQKYNREMMVYQRTLTVTPEMKGKRLFLYFDGVNSVADVFVNRQTVGQHKGGYTAFCFEITDFVDEGDNDLQVWASNAFRTDVLPISGDFNVYGGIHRPCRLIVTERNCIAPDFHASPGLLIQQDKVTDDAADLTLRTILSLNASGSNLVVKNTVADHKSKIIARTEVPAADGETRASLTIKRPILWDARNNPYLYTVSSALYDGDVLLDSVSQQTGFRYFSVDPESGFYINGHHYDLYGFNRHEDFEGKGSALTDSEYDKDMELVNNSGATLLRLAHYPHGEPIYDRCDRDGIVVWSEAPMCGPGGYDFTGYLSNPGFHENARQATTEMVYQKFNHPSVCFLSVFNEILVSDGGHFKAYDDPRPFVKEINYLYKQLDPSRLTCFGTCVDHRLFAGSTDLMAWNKYFRRWNAGKYVSDFLDGIEPGKGGQPVGMSEYGEGASLHHHIDLRFPNEKKGHPEEFQSYIHEEYWGQLKERPWLWAKLIWQFSDIQSSIRNEGDRPGINDKGMVTYDRATPKDSYYFYKANWNKEPMLYLTSRRFTDRRHPDADIKAYTTAKDATLYVNGRKIGKAKTDDLHRVVWKGVMLQPGENAIKVVAKEGQKVLEDNCVWILNDSDNDSKKQLNNPKNK